MATYSQMLKEVQAMTKRAQAKLAEISGEDPDNMPGAENDKDVTIPKEDPEVNDGSMGPESTRSTEGKGDDRPITAGDLFESDESIVNPEEKPLETADANAKEASAKKNLANDILSLIHGEQSKPAEKKAEAKKAEAKKAEAKKAPAKPAKQAEQKKEAATPELNLELTTDVLAKLACAMLAEKEGAEIAEKVMAKQAGADKAREIMDFVAGQEKAAEEYAAGQRAAVQYVIKKAQDLGAADADAAIEAMAAESPEAVAEEGVPVEEVADETAAEPDGGDEEMLPEDAVAEVLMSQLQSGDLTEEDLAEIVEELAAEEPEVAEELGLDLGVDDAGAAVADEAAAEPEAEPAAEPEAEPADEEKAASVKKTAIQKKAELITKIAAASKLLVAHLGK